MTERPITELLDELESLRTKTIDGSWKDFKEYSSLMISCMKALYDAAPHLLAELRRLREENGRLDATLNYQSNTLNEREETIDELIVAHNSRVGAFVYGPVPADPVILLAEIDRLRTQMQDTLNLLRTGTPPDSWGMTFEQWQVHKIHKAAGELSRALAHDKESE